MSDSIETTPTTTTPTSYDLISINDVAIPDVKKGTLNIQRNPKYEALDCEEGNKVIDQISTDKVMGNVQYNGLMQSELQTISAAVSLVSTMTIYNPMTNATRTFIALIEEQPAQKIIHDGNANAWSYGFSFEEIDYAPSQES